MLQVSPGELESLATEYKTPVERLEQEVGFLLLDFKAAAEHFVKTNFEPECWEDCYAPSYLNFFTTNLNTASEYSAGIQAEYPIELSDAELCRVFKEVAVELIARGDFLYADYLFRSELISEDVARDSALIDVVKFSAIDKISQGNYSGIKEVVERLAPELFRSEEYRKALEAGLKCLLREGRFSEMTGFVNGLNQASDQLVEVLYSDYAEHLISRIPKPLPSNLLKLAAVADFLLEKRFQAAILQSLTRDIANKDLEFIYDTVSNYPLSEKARLNLAPQIRVLVDSFAPEIKYYEEAEGKEFVDNVWRITHKKRRLGQILKAFGLKDTINTAKISIKEPLEERGAPVEDSLLLKKAS